MRLRGAGRTFIVVGVIFMMIYVLVSLYGLSATGLRIGTLLLYVGLASLVIGIVLRLARTRV